MFALGPGEIVQQIVCGRLRVVAVGEAWREIVERVPLLGVGVPHETNALASESPMERINNCRAENRGVSHNKSFAVVYEGLLGRRPRQEGFLWVEYVLQSAAPKQSVLAISSKVVVEAGNEDVVIESDGCAETEAHVVKAIAYGDVVTTESRVGLLEVGVHVIPGRQTKCSERIERCNIIRTQRQKAGLRCVRGQANPLHRSARAGRRIEGSVGFQRALVLNDAIAHGGAGNTAHRAVLLPPACSLVIDKEKQTVLLDRTSHRGAEDIADQLIRHVRLSTQCFCIFNEVIIGAGDGVAVIFVE